MGRSVRQRKKRKLTIAERRQRDEEKIIRFAEAQLVPDFTISGLRPGSLVGVYDGRPKVHAGLERMGEPYLERRVHSTSVGVHCGLREGETREVTIKIRTRGMLDTVAYVDVYAGLDYRTFHLGDQLQSYHRQERLYQREIMGEFLPAQDNR